MQNQIRDEPVKLKDCRHTNMQAHCERSVGMIVGLVLLVLATTGATARVKTAPKPHLFFMLADDLVRICTCCLSASLMHRCVGTHILLTSITLHASLA